MKKWIGYALFVVFMAAGALASPPGAAGNAERSETGLHGGRGRMHPEISEEQHQKIRAQRERIIALAKAARNETDEVHKAEIVKQLRAKLTEGAERMQEAFRKRLERAEKGVEKMRARLADAEKNREKKVEEHLQKLLSGEVPDPVPGHPEGGRYRKERSRGSPPPTL